MNAPAYAELASASNFSFLRGASHPKDLVLTAMLCIRRLRDTAKTPSHIAAVLLTSPFVPPVALFWRQVGAVRHRIMYA